MSHEVNCLQRDNKGGGRGTEDIFTFAKLLKTSDRPSWSVKGGSAVSERDESNKITGVKRPPDSWRRLYPKGNTGTGRMKE